MPVFFATQLEGVATYWRIFRCDGVTLGFTSHDRALSFDGVAHRAAPGMIPSAIRRSTALSPDSAEVSGALSHDAIRDEDLAAGLFDGAAIEIGAVDWETLEHMSLYSGNIGQIEQGTRGFSAELRSVKSLLERDLVPRTSPTCRAEFCGKGCNLSAARFTHRASINSFDLDANSVRLTPIPTAELVDGTMRFLSGPQTGITFGIIGTSNGDLVLDRPICEGLAIGTRVTVREGCDHTLATCSSRFANSINFRGEPYLPGNDLLARYPTMR